ncbi:putative cytochrome P450 monooxygenase [Xylogone sp. PMI_703]|nr:putative cytochrome P450 monooxygenase [Xylogone sp. PMI_703]
MLPVYLSLTLAFSAILYLLYAHVIYPLFLSPLSRIPSAHWSSSLSSHWINSHRSQNRTGIAATLLAHQHHGPIILLSPYEISVASLDGLRKIYTGSFEKDESYASEFTNYHGTKNLVSMQGNREHGVRKRMISHVYSKSYIQNSPDVAVISEVLVQRLLDVLRKEGNRDEGFDAYGLNQAIGADFSSAYIFGLANSTDFIRDIETRQRITQAWRSKSRHLPDEDEATKVVEDFVIRFCKEARTTAIKQNDPSLTKEVEPGTRPVIYEQLSSQLSKSHAGKPPVGRENLDNIQASEMLDHFFASIETSRITLTYLQYELSLRPSLQAALKTQLLTLSPPILLPNISSSSSSSSNVSLPSPKEIDTLPLLSAILKEILRLYPPSPAHLKRLVPPCGTTINGYYIPGSNPYPLHHKSRGTIIGTSAQIIHQNPDVFPSPSEFQPERWLVDSGNEKEGGQGEGDEDKRKEMARWWWAFGSGPRMCIGSHLALYFLKLSTAAIYTNFSTEIIDDEGIEQEDAFLAGPKGEKLVLRFHPVSS